MTIKCDLSHKFVPIIFQKNETQRDVECGGRSCKTFCPEHVENVLKSSSLLKPFSCQHFSR